MVEIAGHKIPNRHDELTIEQFDRINFITSDQSLDEIEKWIAKFSYLGVPEDVFEDMEFADFQKCVKDWNEQPEHPSEKQLSIEVDGYTYTASENIGVKDLGMVEKVWKANGEHFAAETLAILFKRDDLSKNEHYTPAHLKHKAKLFKSLPSTIVIPYIVDILKKLTETANAYKNEVATELESTQD